MSRVMADNKDFDSIMKEITGGLTGDVEYDIKYLNVQGDKYKNHELATEILRACGRMMYDMMPDESKEKLAQAVGNDQKGLDMALDEVRYNYFKKDFDKALEQIEKIVLKYEKSHMFLDDAVSEYHCFKEPMEEALYAQYNKSGKDIRHSTVDYATMYSTYGSVLLELKRPEEAEVALKKAMRWNPVNAMIAFEHAETFKAQGLIEEFKECTMDEFKYAYRPQDLARCYRNLGYYYVEKKDYETAVCCLLFSTIFGKNDMAQSELYYISQVFEKNYNPTKEELDSHFAAEGIQKGPARDVLDISYGLGLGFYKKGNMEMAEYFLSIFGAFIDDEEVNQVLEEIR